MKSMVYRGPYRVRVEEKDRPRIEHPNDAIVRVTRAAICGSDLHLYLYLYHGMMPDTRVGATFGHEFIGVVDEVGPSVQSLRVGDRVMVPFNVYCGSCFFCARGLFSNCHNVNPNATAVGGIYGYSHTCGGYDGGQAEYVRVPFADVGPSVIPDWLHDEDALLMTDALATGYFGAQLGDITEGDVVIVLGAGPVGLFAAQSSWLMGAGRVIVVDHLDYRLEKARTMAHAETINFAEHRDVVVEMKRTTGFLGADVVIDAVGAEADGNFLQHVTSAKLKLQGGSPIALNWAIDGVRKGGTVSVMGAYGPMFSAVKLGDALNKGLTLRMNQCPAKRQWPRLLHHIEQGHLNPREIITHRIPLEDNAEGYHLFSAKLDDCKRVVRQGPPTGLRPLQRGTSGALAAAAGGRSGRRRRGPDAVGGAAPSGPVLPTGLRSELAHGRRSRVGRGRADVNHQWLDPIVSMAGTAGIARAVASVLRRRRGRS